jgi:hypothetical protein
MLLRLCIICNSLCIASISARSNEASLILGSSGNPGFTKVIACSLEMDGALHPRANAKLDQRLRSFLSQCAACNTSLSNALSSLNRFGWVESGDMDVTDIRGEIGSTGSSGSRGYPNTGGMHT